MDDSFTQDIKAYLQCLPQLLAENHAGRFVLIRTGERVGIFTTLDEGMDAGYQRFGAEPFLVQAIDVRDLEPKFAQMLACPA